MNTNEKVEQIRQQMKKNRVAAVIIPSDDPHRSEYVAAHWQARAWLTGFDGSAGTAVITPDHAGLWTDFRYYIQAKEQIADSCFKLFKTGEKKVPSFEDWLEKKLEKGDTIGIDGDLFSVSDVEKYKKKFLSQGILLDTSVDYIKDIWTDRPPMPVSKAFCLPVKYAGKSRKEKIDRIRKKMTESKATHHLMATTDDIAWTLNLRGGDVQSNPVNIAFLLVSPQKVSLFINPEKISESLGKELAQDNIEILGYEKIDLALSGIPGDSGILVDSENTGYRLFKSIPEKCRIIKKSNPAIALKAKKNEVEIGHMRKTAVKDGRAVVNFLFWLEHTKEGITEVSVAEQLLMFRKEQDLFVASSFNPIMAYQDHSAMCHYSAKKETDVSIGNSGLFLTDSGGNYFTGTTDITRTISRGEPTKQEISDYTLVLKGHISVSTAIFPSGTKGFQIDTLSRRHMWRQGINFGHGTGHGVGFFLCVHEGPARISPGPVDVPLEKGMLLTNEPGIYREGSHGIRLENMILVDHAFENEFGVFLRFENMTYCHFERDLIDKSMLSPDEIEWVDTYHTDVYEKLTRETGGIKGQDGLADDVTKWLRHKTRPL